MKINSVCLLLLIGIFFHTFVLAQPELDTTFTGGGKFVLNFGALGAGRDFVIQPDNKIVLIGGCFSLNWGRSPLCLVRLNENGSFDTTFSGTQPPNSGYVITPIPGINNNNSMDGRGITIQNDGKLLATGFGTFSGQERVVVARYDTNGSLDTSFGTNGVAVNAINSSASRGEKILVQPDGKILLLGNSGTSPGNLPFVARYLSDGRLDSSFGNNGIANINIPALPANASSFALQPNGKIMVGGGSYTGFPPNPSYYVLARLNTDGSLDTSFDNDGIKNDIPTAAPSYYGFTAIALQNDGKIVAVGLDNTLYRFNSDGSLDTSFDQDGWRVPLLGNSDAYGVMVSASGKITVVGNTQVPDLGRPPILYKVGRFLPDGSTDNSFSDDGFLDIDVGSSHQDGAYQVKFDLQGRTVITGRSAVGTVANPWENSQFSIARLIASPTQNVGFTGRVVKPDGKPVINAYITLQNGSEIVGYARTNPFGYFHFKDVATNQTYTLSTTAKGLSFTDRSVLVVGEVTSFTIYSDSFTIFVPAGK